MRYSFSDCILDVDAHIFTRSGEVVAIEPQVFDLLCLLAEQSGTLVTRDQMVEKIWNGRIVSEATIDGRVAAARRAVGDDGRKQEVIQTVPRRGIRLVVSAEREQETAKTKNDPRANVDFGRERPSIAILPFINMSSDPEQEYFANGIVEDLITALSRFPWLFVTSRNSSFSYAGKKETSPQIAKDLGVRYIVEGSVRSSAGRLRVSAKLLDVVEDHYIWAENFDRPTGDVFELQDSICELIVGSLVPALSADEQKRLIHSSRPDFSAWEFYQKGLAYYYQPFSIDNHAKARKYFDQAIEQDSQFSEAYAMIALMGVYAFASGQSSYSGSPEEILAEARNAADYAIHLDEKNPIAHMALGRIFETSGEFDEAIVACKTAVTLNPNLAIAHHELGFVLTTVGRQQDAINCFEIAIHLSPNDPARWNYYLLKGFAQFGLDRYEDALKALDEAARLRNSAVWIHFGRVACYVALGRMEDAGRSLQDVFTRRPDCTAEWITNIVGHGKSNHMLQVIENLVIAGLPEK